MRIGNVRAGTGSSSKGLHNRGAAFCLNRHHPGTTASDPTQSLHFIEGFPHSYQPSSAPRRIQNHVGQLPVELFRELVTHSLLTFYTIRFLEGGNVKPAFIFLAFSDDLSAIGYQ